MMYNSFFKTSGFSIDNPIGLTIDSETFVSQRAGFCDALVGLIGQRVCQLQASPLTLTFSGGAVLTISALGDGPEAFMFTRPGDLIVVEQNVAPPVRADDPATTKIVAEPAR